MLLSSYLIFLKCDCRPILLLNETSSIFRALLGIQSFRSRTLLLAYLPFCNKTVPVSEEYHLWHHNSISFMCMFFLRRSRQCTARTDCDRVESTLTRGVWLYKRRQLMDYLLLSSKIWMFVCVYIYIYMLWTVKRYQLLDYHRFFLLSASCWATVN